MQNTVNIKFRENLFMPENYTVKRDLNTMLYFWNHENGTKSDEKYKTHWIARRKAIEHYEENYCIPSAD